MLYSTSERNYFTLLPSQSRNSCETEPFPKPGQEAKIIMYPPKKIKTIISRHITSCQPDNLNMIKYTSLV